MSEALLRLEPAAILRPCLLLHPLRVLRERQPPAVEALDRQLFEPCVRVPHVEGAVCGAHDEDHLASGQCLPDVVGCRSTRTLSLGCTVRTKAWPSTASSHRSESTSWGSCGKRGSVGLATRGGT